MAAPRKIKAIVTAIRKFSDGVTAFTFEPEGKCRFRSGQFLHLTLEPYDPSYNWPESRVFSIANSPRKSDLVEILVAPKGDYTWNMVNKMKLGQEVWLKLPYGDFNYSQAAGKDVVLIAGGTGISPFISFLEDFMDFHDQFRSVHLYYGIRKKELLIYDELLDKLANTISKFRLYLSIEEAQNNILFDNKTGILDLPGIFKYSQKLSNTVYYISGPKAMINAVLEQAEKHCVSNDSIFYDKWE